MLHFTLSRIPSPIGEILLVSDGPALRALDFQDHADRMTHLLRLHYGPVHLTEGDAAGLARPLAAYFDGNLTVLATIPVATGGTEFQQSVWAALRAIPPGGTTTYGTLAATIGRPNASRAVGAANGANPVGIVVPCHRVIGADASLTGYGGGLERKAWLLDHERRFTGERP